MRTLHRNLAPYEKDWNTSCNPLLSNRSDLPRFLGKKSLYAPFFWYVRRHQSVELFSYLAFGGLVNYRETDVCWIQRRKFYVRILIVFRDKILRR